MRKQLAPFAHPNILKSNIKGVRVDLTHLKKNVLLMGNNGEGKTAILNALQLALSGSVRDFAGRDEVKLSSVLQELIPHGEDRAEVLLGISDLTPAAWSLEGGKPEWIRPKHSWRLLYEETEAALIGTNPKARAVPWLVSNFVPANVIRSIRPEMTEETQDAFKAYLAANDKVDGSAQLVAVYNSAKKDAARHKRTAKGYSDALKVLAGLEVDAAIPVLTSIQSLTQFQVLNAGSACGVCGTGDIPEEIFLARKEVAGASIRKRRGGTWVPSHLRETLRGLIEEGEEAHRHCSDVADTALGWMEASLSLCRKDICNRVRTHLPPGQDVSIQIGKRFQILRGTEAGFIEPTSGAETVILMAAFACAAADTSMDPCLIVPPDRAYDRKSLSALMIMLSGSRAVGWIQTVQMAPGRSRDKWSCLILKKGKVRRLQT